MQWNWTLVPCGIAKGRKAIGHSIPWEGGAAADQPTGGELSGCAPHHAIPYQLRSRLGTAVPSHHSGLAASFSDLVPDQDNPSSSWENNRENN